MSEDQLPLGERVRDYLLSVPERVVRSTTGLAGGLLRELGDVAVPAAVRRTRLYTNMVDSTLRFLVEQVGQVEGVYPKEGRLVEDFAIRRAAGNGVEFVGILAFRASPVWVMAALADLTGAGRHLIREIASSLRQEGLLEPGTNFETMDQLLDGLERSSAHIAETINTPPLDVAGLRRDWETLRAQVRAMPAVPLPSAGMLDSLWRDLKAEAARQNRSTFAMSSLLALSAVNRFPSGVIRLTRATTLAARRTGELLGESLLGHYRDTLGEIHRTGFLAYWTRQYRPYLRAAAEQFSPKRRTLTEKFLRRRS